MNIVRTVTPVSHDLGDFTVRRAVPSSIHKVRWYLFPREIRLHSLKSLMSTAHSFHGVQPDHLQFFSGAL